jgi:hypothetical protein
MTMHGRRRLSLVPPHIYYAREVKPPPPAPTAPPQPLPVPVRIPVSFACTCRLCRILAQASRFWRWLTRPFRRSRHTR